MQTDFIYKFIPVENAKGTLLLLHGTGGNELDLIPIGQQIAANFNVLSPRGKILENGMPRFFKRLGMGIFDVEDLKFRAEELADFIEEAKKEFKLKGPIVALGYSNGANIASAILLKRTNLTHAVLLRAMVPYQPESLPDLSGIKILILNGKDDPTMKPGESEQLKTLFARAKAQTKLQYMPGGHQLSMDDVKVVKEWLEENVD